MGKNKSKRHKQVALTEVEGEVGDVSEALQKATVRPQAAVETEASGSTSIINNKKSSTESPSNPPLLKQAEEADDTVWVEVRSTEAKGQAIFALRKIKPGTLLLRERPLIRLTQAEEDQDKASDGSSSIVENHFEKLPRATQKTLLKLYDSKKSDFSRVKSIYYSNCYNLSDANRPSATSPGGSAIGILASRINHSCLPNVQFSFDEENNEMLFHAIKPIPRGRELVSNYNSIFELRATRQRKQLLYYGFRCDCEACEAKTEFWAKSDERRRGMIEARREIKNCDKAFEEHRRVRAESDPSYALERLESLLVKEGLVGLPLADVYRSLGKWAERKEDRRAARLWKIKELEICKTCFGERSPRTKLVEAKIDSLQEKT